MINRWESIAATDFKPTDFNLTEAAGTIAAIILALHSTSARRTLAESQIQLKYTHPEFI